MGASFEAPENTLSAFIKAQELGAKWIELDVRVTKDGIPVVIHDGSVGWDFIIPESHPIHSLTLSELQSFDLGSWYSSSFANEPVPTLESVLTTCPNVTHLIEIKWPGFDFTETVETILATLETYGKNYLIGCMVPALVAYIQEHHPSIPLFGIAQSPQTLALFLNLNLKAIALRQQLATAENIAKVHATGSEAWAWTIDDPVHAAELHAMGLDGVVTNNVRRMLTAFPTHE